MHPGVLEYPQNPWNCQKYVIFYLYFVISLRAWTVSHNWHLGHTNSILRFSDQPTLFLLFWKKNIWISPRTRIGIFFIFFVIFFLLLFNVNYYVNKKKKLKKPFFFKYQSTVGHFWFSSLPYTFLKNRVQEPEDFIGVALRCLQMGEWLGFAL